MIVVLLLKYVTWVFPLLKVQIQFQLEIHVYRIHAVLILSVKFKTEKPYVLVFLISSEVPKLDVNQSAFWILIVKTIRPVLSIDAEIRVLLVIFVVLELYANAKIIHHYVPAEKVLLGIRSFNV